VSRAVAASASSEARRSVRLVYLGTPAVAVPPLEGLVAAGHDIALVVTGVDKRRGRGSSLSPSPVNAAAGRLGIPVSHLVDDVLGAGAELGVVVAFGQIIKPHVLAELPMVNLHFSLLPRWRGAAPVERALLAGDERTGVCVMAVEKGLDTGGVYARVEVPGALEIPQVLAAAVAAGALPAASPKARYCGAIMLGCVVRGETSHYDIVCNNANHWCYDVAVRHAIPIGNAILTVDNELQAMARAKGRRAGKGADAVRACLQLIEVAAGLAKGRA